MSPCVILTVSRTEEVILEKFMYTSLCILDDLCILQVFILLYVNIR